MPPHKKKGPPPHKRHVPSSRVAAFVDQARIDALLTPFVADGADRAFLLRCLLDEGPAHHRGANYVLVALLGEVLAEVLRTVPPAAIAAAPAAPPPPSPPLPALSATTLAPVPMRLPPHVEADADAADFPLGLDVAALHRLARPGTGELDAAIDCLTDGPPQHVVANVLMVDLLGAILRALPGATSGGAGGRDPAAP